MKALGIHDYQQGKLANLDVAEPSPPGSDQVQLSPLGISMNPIDHLLATGYGAPLFNPKRQFPVVLGRDAVAQVVSVGSGVSGLEPGQRVLVACSPRTGGTYAERVNVPLRCVAALYDPRLSDVVAAGLGYAGLTALQALSAAGLDEGHANGKHLCINGASGGVGSIALILAAARGARITAVASSPNHDWLRSLAPCTPVDYRDCNAMRSIQADIVINLAPAGTNDPLLEIVKNSAAKHRAYVTTTTPLISRVTEKGRLKGLSGGGAYLMKKKLHLARHGVRYRWVMFRESAAGLASLAAFFSRYPHINPVGSHLGLEHLGHTFNDATPRRHPGKAVFLKSQ